MILMFFLPCRIKWKIISAVLIQHIPVVSTLPRYGLSLLCARDNPSINPQVSLHLPRLGKVGSDMKTMHFLLNG